MDAGRWVADPSHHGTADLLAVVGQHVELSAEERARMLERVTWPRFLTAAVELSATIMLVTAQSNAPMYAKGSANTVCSILTSDAKRRGSATVALMSAGARTARRRSARSRAAAQA